MKNKIDQMSISQEKKEEMMISIKEKYETYFSCLKLDKEIAKMS
jgi:hypothetical protein